MPAAVRVRRAGEQGRGRGHGAEGGRLHQIRGAEKAYAEISNPSGKFVDRDLYIVVYGLDGIVLAHGANASRIGTNQIDDKDPDGKAFVKERVELAKQSRASGRPTSS